MSQATRSRVLDSRGRPVPGIYVKNGRYSAGYNCPTTGKWRMQSLAAKDLSGARKERESLLSGLREGRVAARNDSTVEGVFKDWQSSRRISERTAENEQGLLRHLGPITTRRVQDVTSTEIAGLLKMDGYSEWTRTGVYRIARGLFAHALRRGLVTRNPVDGLGKAERPTQRNARKIRVLDAVEVEALLDAATTPRWKAALALMALGGLRLGEARAVRWADVGDLSIRVARSASPEGAFDGPKTEAGNRDVPLSPLLRRVLTQWRLASPRCADEDLVISTWRGRPVGETSIRGALALAATKAGLTGEERLSPHSLRHGYASRLGLGGLNATTLARILGHTDASFTLRTYCSDQRSVEDVAADVLRASAV